MTTKGRWPLTLANHAAAAMMATWVGFQYTGARTPMLDTLLLFTMGAWLTMVANGAKRQPATATKAKALPAAPAPPPAPLPSPLCTEVLRVNGEAHACTWFDGHDGLHEHADPNPLMPPLHRWYRTSSGTVIGS